VQSPEFKPQSHKKKKKKKERKKLAWLFLLLSKPWLTPHFPTQAVLEILKK
jgi:hypothetical protein